MEREVQEEVELKVYPHQVSGKAPKLYSFNNSRILKGLDPKEQKFYEAIANGHSPLPLHQLRPYLPIYFGKVKLRQTPRLVVEEQDWLQHLASRYEERIESNEFIELQNLAQGMLEPNVFDIKIGGRNTEGKSHKISKSVAQYCIKLNGCKLAFPKPLLLTKYFLSTVTQFGPMAQYLALFLSDGITIQLPVIEHLIQKLKSLLLSFKQLRGYRFISSSICMLYDLKDRDRVDVRLIDFGRVIEEEESFQDVESEAGIENILKLLKDVQENYQKYQDSLPSLLCKCYQEEVSIIPEHKRVGFQPRPTI